MATTNRITSIDRTERSVSEFLNSCTVSQRNALRLLVASGHERLIELIAVDLGVEVQ
jgi:hypothetical protein